jgi:Zn-finger nucleic acid-binding protein
MRHSCPQCLAPHALDAAGACARCGGLWLPASVVEAALPPARLPLLRRHVARGPPTKLQCPRCRAALKAFDVPGFQHEGDLFWGLESPRAATHATAEGCAACGGVWVEAADLARAGGRRAVLDGLARLAGTLL